MVPGLSLPGSDGRAARKIRYAPPRVTTMITLINNNNNNKHYWVLTISRALLKAFYALFHLMPTKEHSELASIINPYCISEDGNRHTSAHGPNPTTLIHLPTMAESGSFERERVTHKAEKISYLTLYEVPLAAITNDHTLGGLKQHKCIALRFERSEG